MSVPAAGPTASQRDWLRVRRYLQEHRHQLSLDAAAGYPASRKVAGTPLLAAPGWQPAAPVPLHEVTLEFRPDARAAAGRDADPGHPWSGAIPGYRGLAGSAPPWPQRPDGTRYRRYSDVLADLAAPAVFENRVTYRLIEAELGDGTPRLAFSRGRYFDGIDTGEAAAHEYAAARLGGPAPPLRARDPCDLRCRPVNLAIAALTLRLEAPGRAAFPLHWRDPAKVGHAGGLYQVIPVGVFQPSGQGAAGERRDFSLWRCLVREFAEELCGRPEDYGSALDYDSWPFAAHLAAARDRGQVRLWCLGLGVDPLSYATDLLTVAVIDSRVFDDLFSLSPRGNAEGRVVAARDFTADSVDRTVTGEPVQAAGAAVLQLAWRHREMLIG